MLRREFLKLASLLGVAVATPVGAALTTANTVVNETQSPEDGTAVIVFKWENREIQFVVDDGGLEFRERVTWETLKERGILTGYKESHKLVDFDLWFQALSVESSELLPDALKHRGHFDLEARFKDETIKLNTAWADTIEYDMSQGMFAFRGYCLTADAPEGSRRRTLTVERIDN